MVMHYELCIIALLAGWGLDLCLGDPAWLPHPIVWFGKWIGFWEHRLNKGAHRKLKGAVMAVGTSPEPFDKRPGLLALLQTAAVYANMDKECLALHALQPGLAERRLHMRIARPDAAWMASRTGAARWVAADDAIKNFLFYGDVSEAFLWTQQIVLAGGDKAANALHPVSKAAVFYWSGQRARALAELDGLQDAGAYWQVHFFKGLDLLLSRIKWGDVQSFPSTVGAFLESVFAEDRTPGTIASYAEEAGISENYLSRLVKKATGRSVGSWIDIVRISRAKRLLAGTDTPVIDVAAAVGLEDQSYFARLFKKETGMTPSVFRKKMQG